MSGLSDVEVESDSLINQTQTLAVEAAAMNAVRLTCQQCNHDIETRADEIYAKNCAEAPALPGLDKKKVCDGMPETQP